MPYIDIDINLDSFDTEDIVEELLVRVRMERITEKDISRIKEAIAKIPTKESLLDTLIMELFVENKDKVDLEQLRAFFNQH